MEHDIVGRLLNSLSVLEQAIGGARSTLMKRETVSPAVIERIDSYSNILMKQRALAASLEDAVAREDWSAVAQKIQLINGLLDLIRQDANEILRDIQGHTEAEETSEIAYC